METNTKKSEMNNPSGQILFGVSNRNLTDNKKKFVEELLVSQKTINRLKPEENYIYNQRRARNMVADMLEKTH